MRKGIETSFSEIKALFLRKIHAVTFKGFLLKLVMSILNNSFSEATINRLARQTRFRKRNRKVPGSRFVNTLLFPECNQVHTSLPDLTSDLNQVYNIDISKEAMVKTRIRATGVGCLYINKPEDADIKILKKIITAAAK